MSVVNTHKSINNQRAKNYLLIFWHLDQIATVKIDKKSSRKGNLVDLLSNSQSTPSSPTHGLGVNPILMRKKSKPELSSSHGDSSAVVFGSSSLNSSMSSPQLTRSSDPSVGTVRRFNTPPPVPASPKSAGSLSTRSLTNSSPGNQSQLVDSNNAGENRNRGFTIGSAYSAPTSPVLGNNFFKYLFTRYKGIFMPRI